MKLSSAKEKSGGKSPGDKTVAAVNREPEIQQNPLDQAWQKSSSLAPLTSSCATENKLRHCAVVPYLILRVA